MDNSRGKILWVDDEIDHLKPHILFLEDKGFSISTASNGADAVTLIKESNFQLILMDQFMPGQDGIQTIQQFSELRPNLPVIMITKSEEEWLMDEAISQKISQFLIKPVSPSQIFMACKQVLENFKIREEKITSGYLKEFQEIEELIRSDLNADEWWNIYNRLSKWQIDFDEHKDIGLGNILIEQIHTCNREFVKFFQSNYSNWVYNSERPNLSIDVVPKFVIPNLEKDSKVCLIVIDALRHDQFLSILPELGKYFNIEIDYQMSLLPSATPFSRNAIFSGLFPDELCVKYPQQLELMKSDAPSLNKYESMFLEDQLKRIGFGNKKIIYKKINIADQGDRLLRNISDYKQTSLLSIVVNFVDMLAHKRAESDVLKEIVPDEAGYRMAIRTWFENSWLYRMMRELSENDFTVIITSDHGTVRVHRGVLVGADRETSSGVRYKYGRNLNSKEKNALIIRKPSDYRLPELVHQTNYLIAKDDVFFLYPNQQHRFEGKLKESFQHGGISMEEIMVPVVTMKGN